jgi:hypothetical protein
MERRRLFAVGGVLSVTAFATTVGLGATFGLFGLTQPDSAVGRLGGPAPAAGQVDPPHGSGAAAIGPALAAGTAKAPVDDGADD